MSSCDHVSETPGAGGDGAHDGEDQRHQGETSQGGAGADQSQSSIAPTDQSQRDLERSGPMTLDIVNVKVNPILVNQQFKRAIFRDLIPAFDNWSL